MSCQIAIAPLPARLMFGRPPSTATRHPSPPALTLRQKSGRWNYITIWNIIPKTLSGQIPGRPMYIANVDRSLSLIEALAGEPGGLPLGVLAERLELPKSAAHRL